MTPVPSIRDATVADTSVLAEIFRESALSVELYRDALLGSPSSLEWQWPELEARVRVIEDTRGLLGFLTVLLPVDEDAAEIDDLFIAPQVQRGGLGRVLVEDAAALALEAGFRELVVIAGEAEPFYLRAGFGDAEPVYTAHAPAVRLTRRLA